MAARQERQRSGPLTAPELEAIFERGYAQSSRRFLANLWGGEADEAANLFGAMSESARVTDALERIGELSRSDRAIFAALSNAGGRARAENLRKELLLRGQGDVSDELRRLARHGVLVVLPSSGQSELELEQILDQQNFLQQELALTQALIDELDSRGITHSAAEIGAWDGEITNSRVESLQSLELNLLHLAAGLGQDVLRLNKSGAPNRRSLSRFITGLTRPAATDTHDLWLDIDTPTHANYIGFLLALVSELGLSTVIEDRGLVGQFGSAQEYFTAPDDRRGTRLVQVVQNLKGWSEGLSPSLQDGREQDDVLEAQLSQTRANGSVLIGARGYIFSVLRRANLNGWTPLEAVIELCGQLDRDYLPRVFANAGLSLQVNHYVRAFIVDLLFWIGAVELGEDSDGVELMRLTPDGQRLLDFSEAPEKPEQNGCLFIQPNFEAMVFLDAAPMEVLYRLYQIGERVNLADRVATFKLTAESVQRGYSTGMNAERAIALLDEHSHAPLADLIEFQLRDWERIWGRVTLWSSGMLIRHEDPDRLDTILGQVRHALRDKKLVVERIAAGAVFLDATPEAEDEILRQLERYGGLRIDYLGEIPPSLESVEGLVFAYEPMTVDFETVGILKKISEEVREECTPRRRVVALDPRMLTEYWPERTFAHIIDFLRPRVRGGLPSEQLLQLKARLLSPPRAKLLHAVVVVTLETREDAQLFGSTEHARACNALPISDVSFAIAQEHLDDTIETLERLGVQMTHL